MKIHNLMAAIFCLSFTAVGYTSEFAAIEYDRMDDSGRWALLSVSNSCTSLIIHNYESHVIQVKNNGEWEERPKPYSYCDGGLPGYLFVPPCARVTLHVLRPPENSVWRIGVEFAELTIMVSKKYLQSLRNDRTTILKDEDLVREYIAIQNAYRDSPKITIWSEPIEGQPNKASEDIGASAPNP